MAKGPLQNKIFLSLVGAVAFMFLFSFMLVPLYNVFCEVTGLNGKIYGPSDFFKKNNETYERQVNIKFLSTINGSAPVTFYPSEANIEVVTDKVSKTSYVATNNTNKRLTLSIVHLFPLASPLKILKKSNAFVLVSKYLSPMKHKNGQ